MVCRSSTRAGVYKPTHGGLVNVDIEKDKSISLRTLVSRINLVGTVVGVTKLWVAVTRAPAVACCDKQYSVCVFCSSSVSQIDRSIVESFGGGGRTCMTARVYPEHLATGSTRLFVFNNGTGAVKVSKLEAWELATASVNSVLVDGGEDRIVASARNVCQSEAYFHQ
jgi:hypothetical protein